MQSILAFFSNCYLHPYCFPSLIAPLIYTLNSPAAPFATGHFLRWKPTVAQEHQHKLTLLKTQVGNTNVSCQKERNSDLVFTWGSFIHFWPGLYSFPVPVVLYCCPQHSTAHIQSLKTYLDFLLLFQLWYGQSSSISCENKLIPAVNHQNVYSLEFVSLNW